MIIELLLTLLIIFIVFLFLIFFKSWHIHIIFKNDNLDYFYRIIINFLLFNISIFTVENILHVLLKINILSKSVKVFEYQSDDRSSDSGEIKEDNPDEDSSDSQSDDEGTVDEVKKIYQLFHDAKDDLYSVVKLLVKMLKFDESYLIMNLGLSDNNMTIKFCTLLWTLFAPLYTVGFKLYLTPEINRAVIKTDANVKFDVYLFNLLRILFLIIRRKQLRDIIQFFRK